LCSTTPPNIGADEFSTAGRDAGITALVGPGTGGRAGCSQPVEVTIRNLGSTATTLPMSVRVIVAAPSGATQTLNGRCASLIAGAIAPTWW